MEKERPRGQVGGGNEVHRPAPVLQPEERPMERRASSVGPLTETTRQLIERQLTERERKAFRRRWTGRGLIVFGGSVLLGSCPLYALALIGPQTVIGGLAVIAVGAGFLAWRPKLKDANEAMIVAMRYGNFLTVPRLALELNVSFERAEKIIQELVRNGIAEIDLDHKDPDHAIVYRVRGL